MAKTDGNPRTAATPAPRWLRELAARARAPTRTAARPGDRPCPASASPRRARGSDLPDPRELYARLLRFGAASGTGPGTPNPPDGFAATRAWLEAVFGFAAVVELRRAPGWRRVGLDSGWSYELRGTDDAWCLDRVAWRDNRVDGGLGFLERLAEGGPAGPTTPIFAHAMTDPDQPLDLAWTEAARAALCAADPDALADALLRSAAWVPIEYARDAPRLDPASRTAWAALCAAVDGALTVEAEVRENTLAVRLGPVTLLGYADPDGVPVWFERVLTPDDPVEAGLEPWEGDDDAFGWLESGLWNPVGAALEHVLNVEPPAPWAAVLADAVADALAGDASWVSRGLLDTTSAAAIGDSPADALGSELRSDADADADANARAVEPRFAGVLTSLGLVVDRLAPRPASARRPGAELLSYLVWCLLGAAGFAALSASPRLPAPPGSPGLPDLPAPELTIAPLHYDPPPIVLPPVLDVRAVDRPAPDATPRPPNPKSPRFTDDIELLGASTRVTDDIFRHESIEPELSLR